MFEIAYKGLFMNIGRITNFYDDIETLYIYIDILLIVACISDMLRPASGNSLNCTLQEHPYLMRCEVSCSNNFVLGSPPPIPDYR